MDNAARVTVPTEIVIKIFEKLDFKHLCISRRVCKRWKFLVDSFDLVNESLKKVGKSKHRNSLINLVESKGFLSGKRIILISGGYRKGNTLETLEILGHPNAKMPSLPDANSDHSMIITYDNLAMVFGGYINGRKQCYHLDRGSWKLQKPTTLPRESAITISMPDGTYSFGGIFLGDVEHCNSSDFLPREKSEWEVGPPLPEPLSEGHGVAISSTELILIGGYSTRRMVLIYNVEDQTWTDLGDILVNGRCHHRSVFFNGKVIVSGGNEEHYTLEGTKSTEIIDLSNFTSKRVGDLNIARHHHGMGIMEINGKDKVVVFGGSNKQDKELDSVEEWDEKTETWTLSTMKLSEPKSSFAYCQINSLRQRKVCHLALCVPPDLT